LDWGLFLQPKQKQKKNLLTIANSLPYLTGTQSQQSNKVVKGFRVMLYRGNGENVDKASALGT
jgi:hypothetical protein